MKKETHEIDGGRKLYLYSFDEDLVEQRQKRFWNTVADAWKEEHAEIERWLDPLTRAVADKIGDFPRRALDLGCGSRSMPLPSRWRTFGVDPADATLTPNRSVNGSSQALPFQDGAFDAVVSRLSIMLDTDPVAAFREARRVLRMGGTFTFVVWGRREDNLFITAVEEILRRELGIRQPESHEPGAFRMADPNEVESMLLQADLKPVTAEQVHVPYFSMRSAEQTLTFLLKYIGPIHTMYTKVPGERRIAIHDELIAALNQKSRDGSAWIHHSVREVKF